MKCLSIRQPWAALVVRGVKTVENRSKATNYRGRLLIHSSQHLGCDEYTEQFLDELDEYSSDLTEILADERIGYGEHDVRKGRAQPNPAATYHFGCIIGEVELVDCIPNPLAGKEFRGLADRVTLAKKAGLDVPNGRFVPGAFFIEPAAYLWIVGNAKFYRQPIEHKGKLNIFDVPDEVVAESQSVKCA